MSTRITTTLIDDLDGSDAAETLHFAFEGVSYAIDLNKENAAAFRSTQQKYASVARKLRSSGASRKPKDESQPSSKEVRAWAEENGIEVNPRGRISDSVVSQYLSSK